MPWSRKAARCVTSALDSRHGWRGLPHLCNFGIEAFERLKLVERDGVKIEAEELLMECVDVCLEGVEVNRPTERRVQRRPVVENNCGIDGDE